MYDQSACFVSICCFFHHRFAGSFSWKTCFKLDGWCFVGDWPLLRRCVPWEPHLWARLAVCLRNKQRVWNHRNSPRRTQRHWYNTEKHRKCPRQKSCTATVPRVQKMASDLCVHAHRSWTVDAGVQRQSEPQQSAPSRFNLASIHHQRHAAKSCSWRPLGTALRTSTACSSRDTRAAKAAALVNSPPCFSNWGNSEGTLGFVLPQDMETPHTVSLEQDILTLQLFSSDRDDMPPTPLGHGDYCGTRPRKLLPTFGALVTETWCCLDGTTV